MSFSVIIPSRTLSNLAPCVESIRAADETCEIVVVWDRSKGNHPLPPTKDYRVCEVESDFVYARNINIGIAAAGNQDVILLNDDTKLKTPMGFSAMVEEAQNYNYLGLVSAVCNNVGNTNQHPYVSTHSESGLCDWCSGDSRDDLHSCCCKLRMEPRMVCFVCVYIPRKTIDKVGLLDERYVKYGLDDDDYSFRVRQAGLGIGIFDGCFVDHSELVSTYRGGPADAGDFKPNLRLFIEKWGHDNRGLSKEQSPWRELFV